MNGPDGGRRAATVGTPTQPAGMALGPSLLDFLASEEGSELRARFSERTLGKGALFRNEEGRDRVLVVRSGRVRVYLSTPERELSLSYLGPDDIFSTHTRAHLAAVEPTALLLADRSALERDLGRYPALRAAIIRVLARMLAQTMTVIEDLAFHDVRGRIARYLLRYAGRNGAPIQAGGLIRVDLNMEEIAALLGATRQTASTEFNALIRAGVIERRDRGRFALLDPKRLQAIAGIENDQLSAG